jgi:hypothetical protein
VPAALLLILSVIYGVSLAFSKIGMFHDDGIYVATAKSLATGNGYRIAGYPGDLPQTKYPPVLPLLLSLAWRIEPNFPANEWLLKAVPAMALLAWSAVCVWFFRTRGRVELGVSLWLLLFTLTNQYSLVTSTSIMSEGLYSALALASLAFLASACEQPDGMRQTITAALFAAAAYQTRTAGIALLAAGLVALLIAKRFKQAALFAVITGGFALAWMAWQAQPSSASTPIEHYYTAANYRDLNTLGGTLSLESILIVALNNALSILLYPARSILQLPVVSGYGLAAALIPSAICWFLAGRGIRRAPSALRPAILFAALTMGMLLFYAWVPPRFLLPVLPVLLLLTFLGLPRRAPWPALLALIVLPLASACLFAHSTWKHGLSDFGDPLSSAIRGESARTVSWDRVSAVFAWVKQNTPEDAIVLAICDPALSLHTGRSSIRHNAASGLDIFYGIRSPLSEKIAGFETLVRKYRPRYLVEIPSDVGMDPDYYRILETLKNTGRLRLVKQIAPRYSIYEVAGGETDAAPQSRWPVRAGPRSAWFRG